MAENVLRGKRKERLKRGISKHRHREGGPIKIYSGFRPLPVGEMQGKVQ